MLNRLTLYVPDAKGGFVARQAGYALDASQREVSYRNAVFRLDLPAAQPQTYYLRIESSQSLRARLDIWQPQAFAGEVAVNQFGWGIYAGLVLALILSSASFSWSTREPGYLLLTVSALMLLLTRLLSEGGLQHGLVLSPGLADRIVGCAFALTAGTLTHFVNRFTQLGLHLPRFSRAFTVSVWCLSLLACMGFLQDRYTETMPLVQITLIVTILLHIVLTAWLVKRGQAQALTVLFALLCLWLVSPIRMSQSLGWISTIFNDSLLLNASHIVYLAIMNYAGHQRYATMRLENAHTQTLLEAVKRLEQANALERTTHQAHRQFVATLSHELRNPLAVIDASVQNLAQLSGPTFDEKTRKRLDKIQDATDRLTLIIDECLTPERLDIAPMVHERKEVPLHELLQDAAEAARLSSDMHQVSLECDPDLRISCNPQLLKLALRTLVDNAVKYTPPGSSICLRGSTDAQAVLIEVADDGPGIDERDLPHIFEKFYRGQSASIKAGTGLGLPLARQVIESHDGQIEVANKAGHGVSVKMRLPRKHRVW